MSIIAVQCRGSGQRVSGASLNTRRAVCSFCSHMQDVRPDGKFRKHKIVTRTRKLKHH